MELEQFLSRLTTKLNKREEFVVKRIQSSPIGRLCEERRGHKSYLVQVYKDNGKRVRHGLMHDEEILRALIKKSIYEDELKSIATQKKVLEICINELVPFDLEMSIKNLKERCPDLSDALIVDTIKIGANCAWAQADYEKSNYKEEEKRHITSRGLKVRSKSELLIAEKLYEYNIAFRYEQVMHIDNTTLIPDFTILRSDGKLFYWEHEGMTNVKKYLDWQQHKGQIYASVNIVPWDNLIITYDDESGNMDLRVVESEIKNKLMI